MGGLGGLKPPQIFEVLMDGGGIDDQFMLQKGGYL